MTIATQTNESTSSLAATHLSSITEIVIEPRSGWRLVDWRELWDYRDLFRFLVWRDIKVRYAQSTLGVAWAIIQPLFSMIVFTVIFGLLAGVKSDGAPYAVFSFVALVPWTYFSNAVTEGVNSLVSNSNMLTKIYFPRLLLPLSAVAAKLLDFGIASVLLGMLLAFYQIMPNAGVFILPLLLLMMILTAVGLSAWLSAMAIQYRDVKHGLNFVMQLLMYGAPVVYPSSLIPVSYAYHGVTIPLRALYAVNPMVGVIEGSRSALLGTNPMPWNLIVIGFASACIIAFSGISYFRSKEKLFADVA